MGGYDEMVFRSMVRDDAYFYDNTDGDNGSGVPTTAADCCLVMLQGELQSEKAATASKANRKLTYFIDGSP